MSKKQLYIVVSDEGKFGSIVAGSAWAIGTWRECALWQLANGRRADTQIIPF